MADLVLPQKTYEEKIWLYNEILKQIIKRVKVILQV